MGSRAAYIWHGGASRLLGKTYEKGEELDPELVESLRTKVALLSSGKIKVEMVEGTEPPSASTDDETDDEGESTEETTDETTDDESTDETEEDDAEEVDSDADADASDEDGDEETEDEEPVEDEDTAPEEE